MKNWFLGFTEKSDFYEGDSQKTNIEGRIVLKGGLAQFPNLRGLDKKEVGGVFEGDMGGGGWYLNAPYVSFHFHFQIFLKIKHRCLKEVMAQLLYIVIFIIMEM